MTREERDAFVTEHYPDKGAPWTAEQLGKLMGKPVSTKTVQNIASALGIKSNNNFRWQGEPDNILHRLWPNTQAVADEILTTMGRDIAPRQVYERAYRIGLVDGKPKASPRSKLLRKSGPEPSPEQIAGRAGEVLRMRW
jgi:hypothetical protein